MCICIIFILICRFYILYIFLIYCICNFFIIIIKFLWNEYLFSYRSLLHFPKMFNSLIFSSWFFLLLEICRCFFIHWKSCTYMCLSRVKKPLWRCKNQNYSKMRMKDHYLKTNLKNWKVFGMNMIRTNTEYRLLQRRIWNAIKTAKGN